MTAIMEKNTVKRRTKGEQTRKQILHAAVEVLAQQGIKGTTHRAIAKHAGLQLSLTTYYFKDIQELVHQAFQLNSADTMAKAQFAWQQTFDILDSYSKTELRKVSLKEELRETLTELATNYLLDKVKNQPITLAVEQLLFTYVQTTPELRQLAKTHRDALKAPFSRLCRYFSKNTAEIDAEILLTVFTQLEYKNLGITFSEVDANEIYEHMFRLLSWVLKLK
ncbi:TetR/AcrR family transcriptional regulator [Thalassotalea fusca]